MPRHLPRFALTLLDLFVPDSDPLAGDLVEEFNRHRSVLWLWLQVLAAIAGAAWRPRSSEIRPLRLVDLQPADAIERTRRLSLRFAPVNVSGSPVAGVGGLGLAIFGCLMSGVAPGAWWLLLSSALAGCGLGILLIVAHKSEAGEDRRALIG